MTQRAIAEIRSLYEHATPATIERDLTRAVALLKSLPDEETRERVAVFMDGLSQLRSEWRIEKRRKRSRMGRSKR